MTLKHRILAAFFAVIALFGVLTGLMGFYVIKHYVIGKARQEVREALASARSEYAGKITKLSLGIGLVSVSDDLGAMKKKMQIDYLFFVPEDRKDGIKSEIAKKALDGEPVGGTRIIGAEELKEMGGDVYTSVRINVKPTPKARRSDKKILDEAMAIEYATPVSDAAGGRRGVLYGGRMINNDFPLVDKIRDLAFGNELYESKPIGTVTMFLDDVRVATNVLDENGQRAVGTRVSESVYDAVVAKGGTWRDRAFVVTDWYLTAYEPIKDINGKIIGILYVGILEKPYKDLMRNFFLALLATIAAAMALAVFFAVVLASAITAHVTEVVDAADRIARGETGVVLKASTSIREFDRLASSFNNMAGNLHESSRMLKVWNEKLSELNKNYLDLVGFVSHELKGILASTTLNAYSVRDGFLGMVNFKQGKALDSVTRNLDYLASTVRNFLNLSRIEKGEINLNKTDILLKEDIFNHSVDGFHRQAVEKNMIVTNEIEPGLKIFADPDLLEIAANNLVGNAIKYGADGGKVLLSSKDLGDRVEVDVYNDGRPLTAEETEKLFKRFSRLTNVDGRKVRGSGLGLFITKDIIEKHGGAIRVEPRESGNSFVFEIAKK